jgi:multisubunit Na+/H+ antiporter MnhF subunit
MTSVPVASGPLAVLLDVALVWSLVLLAIGGRSVVRGDSPATRILALDTCAAVLVATLVLVAARERSAAYLDAALVLALLSFVGTVAAARYYEAGRVF